MDIFAAINIWRHDTESSFPIDEFNMSFMCTELKYILFMHILHAIEKFLYCIYMDVSYLKTTTCDWHMPSNWGKDQGANEFERNAIVQK